MEPGWQGVLMWPSFGDEEAEAQGAGGHVGGGSQS